MGCLEGPAAGLADSTEPDGLFPFVIRSTSSLIAANCCLSTLDRLLANDHL